MSTAASMRRGCERRGGPQWVSSVLGPLLVIALAFGLSACSHASFHRELPASKVQQAAPRPPWRTPDKPTTLTPAQLRVQLQTLVDAMLRAERPAELAAQRNAERSTKTDAAVTAYLRFYLPSVRTQVINDLYAVLNHSTRVGALPRDHKIALRGRPLPARHGCIISKASLTEILGSSNTRTVEKALIAFDSSPAITFGHAMNNYTESPDTRIFIVALFKRVRLTVRDSQVICAR